MFKKISTPRFLEGGFSTGNYANFNLATHTGDNSENVAKNRALLVKHYNLPQMPKWLEQTHSNICLDDNDSGNFADSVITRKKGVVCTVLTADCLPIFAWSDNPITKKTEIVGVAHAGWQGIFNGVIEKFISNFCTKPENINIEFGTALGVDSFEVGIDFYQNFINKNKDFKQCFTKFNDKYKFNIYQSATVILQKLGVKNIINNRGDTFTDNNLFSYRRDGEKSGRQAHLIWIV